MKSIFENDFHVHTHHSPCAKDKFNSQPLRMLEHAESLGIKTIGFTDHFAQSPQEAIPVFKSCGPTIIDQLREELRGNRTSVRVLIGCEADQVTLNAMSINKEYAQQIDFVMVSASHFHLTGVQQPTSLEPRTVAEHYLAFLRKALEPEFVSVIAHPFYAPYNALGEPETYMAQIEDEELYEIAKLALRNKVAMEINGEMVAEAGYLRAMRPFYRICRQVGVRFTYGSDAHYLQKLGGSEAIMDVITSFGLGPDDFLSADELVSKCWSHR